MCWCSLEHLLLAIYLVPTVVLMQACTPGPQWFQLTQEGRMHMLKISGSTEGANMHSTYVSPIPPGATWR